uniref:Uncharacterized protein n=1 Tax=Ixodes ricinus TaxID=34613 RepID=A0A0K8RK58_IXORI
MPPNHTSDFHCQFSNELSRPCLTTARRFGYLIWSGSLASELDVITFSYWQQVRRFGWSSQLSGCGLYKTPLHILYDFSLWHTSHFCYSRFQISWQDK